MNNFQISRLLKLFVQKLESGTTEGPDGVGPSTYQDIEASEISSIPDITDTISLLEAKSCDLERDLQSERTLVTKFRIDGAVYKSSIEDLTLNYNRETLSILTKHANKNPFYKARPGLGLAEKHILEKAPSNLYNFEDMAASKPNPAIVGGHVTKEYVRQTITYTEVINGETITRTTSPSNSTTSSPPTSPARNRPIFVPARDPDNTDPSWEGIKDRTPCVAMPPINYADLNTSYATRKIVLSEEILVIPPTDVSATKSPDLVELEKEVFGLRLKAMDLDACQHQILNLRVIVSEKDTLIHTLEKDLLEANAERIRLSSECETASSSFTIFKTKFPDLQKRLIIQEVQFELEKELLYEKEMMYRQTFVNQDVSISRLKKKVLDFENFYSIDSDDDETSLVLSHRISKPKPKPDLDPNVEYELKVLLDEGDDPSSFVPKKKKSVISKPEKPAESQASGSEKSNPKGGKRVGTDKEKSVKPHTPKGLQTKNSKSNDACASVKPIQGLDFNSSTFEVGETSRLKPNQPFSSTKPNFLKPSSGKCGKSISTKPSSNSHHALNADGRRKDGGKNVKPPRKDHQEKNNTFSSFPKRRGPSHAGLGHAPPSVGFKSNMSVNSNRNLNDAFNAFRNDMCSMFDNILRYGVANSLNAHNSNVKSRKRKGRKRGKSKSSSSVKSPTPKEKSKKGTTLTISSIEGLGYNMFSSSQFCDNGYWVKQFLYGSDLNDEDNNTHPQFEALSQPVNAISLLSNASKEDSWLWHQRLCHQNFKDMNKLVSKCLVKQLLETRLSKDTLCPSCEKGKMRRSSHPPKMDTNSKVHLT
ncbi:hypothetical protein OSB04_029345 [Centaurea solstitialis]|uniref:GAG-pre-integrase domain-containing protein n=1 Tax=Centaurea solstitialis TaxID=347529 RepID=A0AA38WA66_9ASTR|nr:hypothetical protein OSB04_029345 [Centaurea solstitialis]